MTILIRTTSPYCLSKLRRFAYHEGSLPSRGVLQTRPLHAPRPVTEAFRDLEEYLFQGLSRTMWQGVVDRAELVPSRWPI